MTDVFVPLPWQHDLWRELAGQARDGQIAHALLLAGPRGVGKRHFAVALTAYLLCESRGAMGSELPRACGQCRSCQQLAVGAHPNANLLGRDGHLGLAATADGRHDSALIHWEPKKESKRQDVTIDAARSVMDRLALTSHYGQAKMVMVDPADDLNHAAANALLKTMEEPTPGTHLMLVSERPMALPATLRSRCQRIRFAAPPTAVALQWLALTGVSDAASALAEANGAPLLAAQWARDGALGQRREWAELWRSVALRKRDPVSAAATVPKEELPQQLDWLLRWLTAQLRGALGGSAADASAAGLSSMIQEALQIQRLADGNANPQMLLESLLIQWARLTRTAAA